MTILPMHDPGWIPQPKCPHPECNHQWHGLMCEVRCCYCITSFIPPEGQSNEED